MMDQLIQRFTEQLREAIDIGRSAKIRKPDTDISHVYVAGLGGSGIGADFVASFIDKHCPVPYLVGKGYDIPAYIDQHSYCIASSYSGNTEETLSAFDHMRRQGAQVLCISSNGKLIELAEEHGYDQIKVPSDWPSPRACLGYSVVAQMFTLLHLGLIKEELIQQLEPAITLLEQEEDDIRGKAERIASFLHNRIPIIYISGEMEPVAVRFRQQINENAKMLCWHHTIPEMNHNELVGWRTRNQDLAVVFFRNRSDFIRNAARIDINKEIIGNYTDTTIEVYSKGTNLIERSLYLVHLGDWISWYLAQLRGVDAVEVEVIDFLKGELAKLN